MVIVDMLFYLDSCFYHNLIILSFTDSNTRLQNSLLYTTPFNVNNDPN